MKKILFLTAACLILAGKELSAQESAHFSVEVSSDSILMGNYFKVVFTLENANGEQFEAPLFQGFDVVSGPNFSSSISMINGQTSQKVSYTYYLRAREIGNYYIEPASIAVGEKILETLPVEVIVAPNPEGIIQKPEQPESQSPWGLDGWEWPELRLFAKPLQPESPAPQPQAVPKKKRKTYKL